MSTIQLEIVTFVRNFALEITGLLEKVDGGSIQNPENVGRERFQSALRTRDSLYIEPPLVGIYNIQSEVAVLNVAVPRCFQTQLSPSAATRWCRL